MIIIFISINGKTVIRIKDYINKFGKFTPSLLYSIICQFPSSVAVLCVWFTVLAHGGGRWRSR